ncbi:hypothetical protein BSSX_1963 [Bacillus subtilis]|nr:hypothetical protein BSSX_1963 [Bacillus subtilis]
MDILRKNKGCRDFLDSLKINSTVNLFYSEENILTLKLNTK